MEPNWYQPEPNGRTERSAFADPTAAATVYHKRQPINWGQVAPYLVAVVALGIAVAVLMLTMSWRTGMQNQVNLLRHQLATTQSQLATAADAGGSQISRLNRTVKGLRTDVNAISGQLAPYTAACTTDATGPSGLAVYTLPCRP